MRSAQRVLPVDDLLTIKTPAERRGIGRAFDSVARFARLSPIGTLGALFLIVVFLVAIFAPFIAPYDPLAGDYAVTRHPPTIQHVLGTDDLGRDVLSRIIFGARITMLVSVTSTLIGGAIAFLWGV